MRLIQHFFNLPVWRNFALYALLLLCAIPVLAQHTVVQDEGGGRKLELHYNAAGQITETRTLGPDGQLLEKEELEYSPLAYIPQTTSTTYWPNGKIRRLARNTYDTNSNFTGEFIQVFDESGKQVTGHRLTHDPQTGVFQCFEWNVAAQDYKARDCPAEEESSGTPEVVKKFTQNEVMQQLQHARQAASEPQTTASTGRGSATSSATTNVKEVGLILPAQIRPGQRISGSVVEDPSKYEGMPEVTVARVALPFDPSGAGSTLAGWALDISGEPSQPADGPIALTVPPGQPELAIAFHPVGNPGAMISKAVATPRSPHGKSKAPASFQAPAICFANQLCAVRGPFSGNSSQTFAAFEERPAKILAETSDTAYVAIPARTDAGPRPLIIAEGTKVVAFPMVVGKLGVQPDGRNLKKGDTQLMTATLAGPEELPDAEWRQGNYPVSNLAEAQKLFPGFQAPRLKGEHEEREAKKKQAAKGKASGDKDEDEEEEGGEILLIVKNLTPQQVALRQSKNGLFVFRLNAASFKMGDFNYKFVVEANQAGSFDIQTSVIPFLAPVTGQEFPMSPGATPSK